MTQNFADQFLNWIRQYNNDLATETVNHLETPKSFEDLENLVNLFEKALLGTGISIGQHIVVSGPNSVAFLCVSLAIWRLNCVLIPLNPSYKPAEFHSYLEKTDCKLLLIDASFAEKFDLTNIDYDIKLFDENGLKICKCKECQSVNEPFLESKKIDGNLCETAVIFFSSGTTGVPKMVKIGHNALCAHLDIIASVHLSQVLPKIGHEDICLSILPYFHAGGLLTAFVMLAQGAKLIVWRQFEREKFFELIYKYNVTILSIVPTILEGMSKLEAFPDNIKKFLRYIFVGGDRLQPEYVDKIQGILTPKQQIVQLFGTTEAGVLVFMRPILDKISANSCGIPLPGVEFKCATNGELLLKTRTMMLGYSLEGENLRNNAFDEDGWLKTGDLVDVFNNGSIRISGRLKDIIKINGWQVSPYEIESSILKKFEEIEQLVVLEHEQKLYAMVELKSEKELKESSVMGFVKGIEFYSKNGF